MASDDEIAAMRRAIGLAAKGLGRTSPNPVVGAVVLDAHGAVAGEGWHQRVGEAHAEVVALAAAGERARGGTVVVTLEPCAHYGQTHPCVDALLAAGVARVVYAVVDPNAVAAGGGAALRAGGVDVEAGVLEDEAARGNESWLLAVRRGRPFVTWKYAASLDGRVAAADGSSRWITGEAARADAHRLRSEHDAVLVGAGTVLVDDPHLTVRDAQGSLVAVQPLRVVADRRGRVPASARVRDDAARTLILAEADPAALLARLQEREVRSVLLEGGPTLAAAFLEEGLVDKVVGYLAALVVGGGGLPAVAGSGARTIADVRRLRLADAVALGDDLRLTAYPRVVA